jgi:hypothetical protein
MSSDSNSEERETDILEGVAKSTSKGENRFVIRVYLRIANRTLKPSGKRESDFTGTIFCEYPTYEEEIEAKKNNTIFDEYHSIHVVDHDKISEWRLRRCIVNWDLHKIPGFTKRLHRRDNLLTDDTFQLVLRLPPLIRKFIINKLWEALGPV